MGLVHFIIGLAAMICMIGIVIGLVFLLFSIPILKIFFGVILILIITVVTAGICFECKGIGEDIIESFKNRKVNKN